MRPVIRGKHPVDQNGEIITFSKYNYSKKFLIDRLGMYCSYCENSINANLAVEHIFPKEHFPHLELSWDNFLLACTNCNSTKGQKVFNKEEYIFPDSDNSFLYFKYDHSGIVKPTDNLISTERQRAQNTISLVGLDKTPYKEYSTEWQKASDSRFEKRLESYYNATKYKEIYQRTDLSIRPLLIEPITDIVKNSGFWSIWMQVFSDLKEILDAILHALPGTNISLFKT